jgi:hypothetical protein
MFQVVNLSKYLAVLTLNLGGYSDAVTQLKRI